MEPKRKKAGQVLFLLAMISAIGCGTVPDPQQIVNAKNPQAASASSTAVNEINQSLSILASQSTSSPADYRIGPEDLIQITIFNIPEQEA